MAKIQIQVTTAYVGNYTDELAMAMRVRREVLRVVDALGSDIGFLSAECDDFINVPDRPRLPNQGPAPIDLARRESELDPGRL